MKEEKTKINIFSYTFKELKRNFNKGIAVTILLSSLLITGVINGLYLFKVQIENSAVSMSTDYHAQFQASDYDQGVFIVDRSENEKVMMVYDMSLTAFTDKNMAQALNLRSTGVYHFTSAYKNILKSKEPFSAKMSDVLAEKLGIKNEDGEEFILFLKLPSGEIKSVSFVINKDIYTGSEYTRSEQSNIIMNDAIDTDSAFFFAYENFYSDNGNVESKEKPSISRDIFVKYKKNYDPRQTALKIAEEANVSEDSLKFNELYLSIYDSYVQLSVAAVFIIALIVFTGTVVIYNIFNILITKKVNQIGLLTIIGASKKQIALHICCEAAIYTAFGLPAGLMLGTAATLAVMPYLKFLNENYEFILNIYSYILSVASTVVTVALGVIIPAFKAAKITPIEAVRYSQSASEGKSGNRKFFNKISISVLAEINLARNKSRTNITILSLCVSGILFLLITSVLMTSYTSLDQLFVNNELYDIELSIPNYLFDPMYFDSTLENEFTDENMNKLKNIDGIEAVYRNAYIDFSPYSPSTKVYAYDDTLLQMQLDAVTGCSVTLDDLNNGTFLCFQANVPHDYEKLYNHENNINYTNEWVSISDNTASLSRKYLDEKFNENKTYNLKVLYLAPSKLCLTGGGSEAMFITTANTLEQYEISYHYNVVLLKIDLKKYDTIYRQINEIFHNVNNISSSATADASTNIEENKYYYIRYQSPYENTKEARKILFGVIVISLAVVFIITLVGIMSLINTIVTEIEQRKKELGILSAIGMSKRDIEKLLQRETRRISVKSILISSVSGIISGFLIICWMTITGADYMTYRFPLIELMFLILIYWCIPEIASKITYKNLSKNIIDLIGTV